MGLGIGIGVGVGAAPRRGEGGEAPLPPLGFHLLKGADGKYIKGADGAYVYGKAA